MNKTTLYMVCSLSILSISNSNADNNSCNYFRSGAYVGAAAGYSYMNTSVSDQVATADIGQPALKAASDGAVRGTKINHNIVGDILLGYKHFLHNGLVLGAEVDLGRDNNKISKNLRISQLIKSNTSVKSTYKFLPSIIIGQKFNERWLGYVKLGMSFRGFKINNTYTNTNSGQARNSDSFKKTGKAFMAAVGAEYAINKNVSATCDVSYERFKKINLNYTGIASTNDSNRGSIKPSYMTVKLGVLYRF